MKLSNQELFDRASESLRTYGNPYGSFWDRLWGWCNPANPNERCAIARFIPGNNNFEIKDNLLQMMEHPAISLGSLVSDLTYLFDMFGDVCNTSWKLENHLKRIAHAHSLEYNTTNQKVVVLQV